MLDPSNLRGTFLGNYRVQEMLGFGGFGYVYKGKNDLLGETVAIKVLKSLYNERDPEAAQKFADLRREALTHKELKHPFILRLLNMEKQLLAPDQQEAIFYLVMEYAPGGSLRAKLKEHPGQPLQIQQALTILWQIGQALHYAHQGTGTKKIIHRDLKPENILFNAEGDPVVADFGLAIELASSQTALVEARGTPAYMSPEQFDGQVSVKSDQYALGCIAYELLTGRHPFPGGNALVWHMQHKTLIPDDPTKYNAQVSAVTSQAILKAMAKDRHERHDTILQFVEVMRDVRARKSFDQWYREGHIYYEVGNHAAAFAAYQEASLLRPTFADAHFNQGAALSQLQRYEQATAAFKQAIACDDRQLKFYVQCGMTFSQRGLFAEAVEMYHKAVQLEPGHKKACELLGDAYYALKQSKDAAQVYKQALGLHVNEAVKRLDGGNGNRPEEARLYMNLGLALKDCQESKEALQAFECAIALNPHHAQAYYHKGDLLYESHLDRPAVKAFEQALHLDAKYIRAYRAKSQALKRLGLHAEARLAEEMADDLEEFGI